MVLASSLKHFNRRSGTFIGGRAGYSFRFESTTRNSLPSIPQRPGASRPLPWLSLAQIDEYLIPLRAHIPWTFTTNARLTGQKDQPGWSYYGRYAFRTLEFSSSFAARVRDVLHDEDIPHSEELQPTDFSLQAHLKPARNAEMSSLSPSAYMLTAESEMVYQRLLGNKDVAQSLDMDGTREDEALVALTIKTHNAYIPEEILVLRPQFPATKDTPFPSTLTVPGLTIRDVRFAMLVDNIFRDEYLKTGHGLEPKLSTFSVYPSAEQMASNIFRQGFCKCCGLPHPLHTCSKRKRYPPVGQCNICGGSHWIVDCPRTRKSGVKKKSG